jgi:tetratricopeptide (TPR) repeat protein
MGYAYLNPPALLALGNQFGLTRMLQATTNKEDPELNLSTMISSVFSIAATSALQPTQLTSEGYIKLATRPIPKLTAQQFIDRANVKAETYDGDWAIANFTRALSLEPNNADAYYGRATVQTNIKNYLGAIEDYDRTIQLEPKKVNAYLDRSKSKQQTYDYIGSLNDASKALSLTTEEGLQADAYYLRSVAKFNQGNYAEALNDLKQSTTLNPYRDSTSLSCSIEARSGNPNALKTCNQAGNDDSVARMNEPMVQLSAHLCLARAQNKDPDAFQDCGKAITNDPENPIVHEVQGLARLAAGDKKGAIFSLEKALKLYTILGDRTAIDRVQAKINQN